MGDSIVVSKPSLYPGTPRQSIVPKPSWYPGTQGQWDKAVDPLRDENGEIPRAIQRSVNVLTYVGDVDAVDEAGQSAFVDDYFMSVMKGEGWQDRLRDVESTFRSIISTDPTVYHKINVLRLLSRISPESQDKLFTNVLTREGKEPVEVPSLPAVLSGVVPLYLSERSALGNALKQINEKWYGGDIVAFVDDIAADIGYSPMRAEAMILGWHLPRKYSTIVKLAERLGVDPHVLDVLWFADQNVKMIGRFINYPLNKSNRRARARFISRLASLRLGEKYRHRTRPASPMHHYLDMASFAMRAGIHPQTVIPVVATIDEDKEFLFDDAVAYAEQLNSRGKPWKAAILCYLAAHNMLTFARLIKAKEFVHQGNAYILGSGRLPDYLNPEQAGELRRHYLWHGLKLIDSAPEIDGYSVADILGYRSTTDDEGQQPRGYGGVIGTVDDFEGGIGGMSGGRRAVLEEYKAEYPELWQLIEASGRTDIVEQAFSAVDHRGGDNAVSFVAFNLTMRGLTKAAGILPEGFGQSHTKAEYIGPNDTWEFGGYVFSLGMLPTKINIR